jgi:hypothetical protein
VNVSFGVKGESDRTRSAESCDTGENNHDKLSALYFSTPAINNFDQQMSNQSHYFSDSLGSFLVLFVFQEKRTANFLGRRWSLKNFIEDDGAHLFARFFFGRKSDPDNSGTNPYYFLIFF